MVTIIRKMDKKKMRKLDAQAEAYFEHQKWYDSIMGTGSDHERNLKSYYNGDYGQDKDGNNG